MKVNLTVLRALFNADIDALNHIGIQITDNTVSQLSMALQDEGTFSSVEGSIVEMTAKDSEFGARFRVRCAECYREIDVADSARWDQTCSCGYHWRVAAIGEKE